MENGKYNEEFFSSSEIDNNDKIRALAIILANAISNSGCEDIAIISAAAARNTSAILYASIHSGVVIKECNEKYIEAVLDACCPDGYMVSMTVVKDNVFKLD